MPGALSASRLRWVAGYMVLLAVWACGGKLPPAEAPASHPVSRAPVDPLASRPCLWGCPQSNDAVTWQRVDRELYSLANNPDTKFADWVAYEVRVAWFGAGQRRSWRADPDLPEASTLEPADYKGAHAVLHTDRGHQAPLAAFCGHALWPTTNYLSNITPQRSALNEGPWMRLESRIRALARQRGTVFVTTGPLYERAMTPLPQADEPHRVPSGYWKLIALQDGRAAIFILDQESERAFDECRAHASLDELEQRTHLDLLPALGEPERPWLSEGALMEDLGCSGHIEGTEGTVDTH